MMFIPILGEKFPKLEVEITGKWCDYSTGYRWKKNSKRTFGKLQMFWLGILS